MSKVSINDPLLLERQEQENAMYHRIMQDGRLDRNGYLIEPPADMTPGKIQYTV